jgi:hypothetical protein
MYIVFNATILWKEGCIYLKKKNTIIRNEMKLSVANMCHLYRYIFDNNVLQFYLDRPLNYIYKPYICKMYISAHNLNIETGRFYIGNLPNSQSACTEQSCFCVRVSVLSVCFFYFSIYLS